jgi:hypothetical protein
MSIDDCRLRAGLLAFAAMLSLGGCMDSNTTVKVNGSVSTDVIMHRSDASPRGAAVAFASLDGPPGAVGGRFAQDLATAAGERDISIADAKSARYFVRGYLTAYPTGDGTEVSYVWDVFDTSHRRAQRVTDAVDLKGMAADPWSLVDDKALDQVAAKSADDLASFLATTPEAIAYAAHVPASQTAAVETAPPTPAPAGARPLSYAPTE